MQLVPTKVMSLGSELARAVWAVPRAAQVLADLLPALVVSLDKLTDLHDELEALANLELSLQKLVDLQDELEQLGRLENVLERIAEFDVVLAEIAPPLRSLSVTTATLPDLARAADHLPELNEQVQGMRGIVHHIDTRIDELVPLMEKLATFAGGLEGEIDELGTSLEPISRLADRLPGNRRKRKA